MRKLAHIARKYDKGFGHFTTRTNIQFNWIKLVDVPDILAELASCGDALHPDQRQLRAQCHRRPFRRRHRRRDRRSAPAGRDHPPMVEPASGIRLPGAQIQDRGGRRASTTAPRCNVTTWRCEIVKNAAGRIGYKVIAGGGMGRTPYIAHVMSEFVEREDILAYLEAVLRVYNQDSRRDNIHKQRIKILINTIGPEEMRRRVAREFEEIKRIGTLQLPQEELDRIAAYFAPPDIRDRPVRCHARWRCRISPTGRRPMSTSTSRARLCHRHHLAEEPSARCRATPPPTRWTPSPT